jgi:hypothetical protein
VRSSAMLAFRLYVRSYGETYGELLIYAFKYNKVKMPTDENIIFPVMTLLIEHAKRLL